MNNLPANKNRRVLVIDDNRAIHDDFRKILCPATATEAALDATEVAVFGAAGETFEQTQFEMDSAYQGQAGVHLAAQALEAGRPYALAFVDVRMPPGWDGVETTRKLWELDPNLQIVICTAYSDYSWKELFAKLGQQDGLLILKKPFDAVEAFQLAHALTEKWWLHQQSRRKVEELERRVAERTAELTQSETLYHSLVENVPQHIFRKDRAGRFTFGNSRFCLSLGKPLTEILGRTDQDFFPAPIAAKYQQDDQRVIESGQPFEAEEENPQADGSTNFVHIIKTPLRDDAGLIIGIQGISWDVTERKRAEETLRESEDRYRLLVEESPDAIGIYQDAKLVFVNSTGIRLMHARTAAELLGRKSEQIIHPDDLTGANDRVRRRLAGERGVYPAELRYVRVDGTTVPVEVSAAPILFNGEPAMQFIARDITERKRVEEALRESEARFSGAFAHAPIGVTLVSPDDRLFKVNRAFCDLLGYSEAELLTRTFHEITYSEDQEASRENVHRLRAGEIRSFEIEKRYRHRHGHLLTALTTVSLLRDGQGQPLYFIAQVQDITERKQAELALRESNEKFHQLADNITDVFWIRSPDLSEVQYLSPASERVWGRSVKSLLADPHHWIDFILPEDRERVLAAFDALKADAPSLEIEYRIVRPDGEVRSVQVRGIQIRDAGNNLIRHVGIVTDITERKRLEAQVFQSQKLETVGKLAGGIAHEFNSILTAILGRSDLLLEDLPAGSALVEHATEISKAASRAATLTRQLLAYGRKQFLRPENLDLNQVLAGMAGVLQPLMADRGVSLNLQPAPGLRRVMADVGQIEQVIMNLVINAGDAMPHGGKLTIETANVSLDAASLGHYPELKPGDFVRLAITDNGIGMSAAVKARVFEPFYTTKGVGHGTGLGLSTCYGIVKQSGGHISVYSEPGQGTTFKIYLPQMASQTQLPVSRLDSPELPRGTETILYVEDDPALREMVAMLLRRLGYNVVVAVNGLEALKLKQERDLEPIDLLFTDVVMPDLSGIELADRMRALAPHTRVLFTSAYTEHAMFHQGVLSEGAALLQKPFSPAALAEKLREVLAPPGAAQKNFNFTKDSGELPPPGKNP